MNEDKLKMQLETTIDNLNTEVAVYDFLADVAYTGQWNKRIETHLNKLSAERWGTRYLEGWGPNGEGKTVPNISFYYRKEDYIGVIISFSYQGKKAQWDYDTKRYAISDRGNEIERINGMENINDLHAYSRQMVTSRQQAIAKARANLKQLPELIANHKRIKADIEAHNDMLSYAIGDDLRLHR